MPNDDEFDLDDLLAEVRSEPAQPSVAAPEETDEPPPTPPEPLPAAAPEETDEPPPMPSEPPPPPTASLTAEDEDGEFEFNAEARDGVASITKPWMQYHKFTLVQSVEEVREIVDAALAHGRCSLDLETEGLDNRIDYDDNNQPHTRHKIVGYCISVRGHGYYIPIRHKFDTTYESNPNLPSEAVDVEIKRLCLASQPVLTEQGKEIDPFASTDWVRAPQVVIYFWNGKFDQEFLYPVTGIDFWHPDSWEDGYLAAYVWYTDDQKLGLKGKSPQKLSINGHPYVMIELPELFPKGTKKSQMDFSTLYPEPDNNVTRYGCSDAICTEILCEQEEMEWDLIGKDPKPTYKNVLGPTLKDKRFRATYRLEKQTVQAVRVMERTRTKVDKEATQQLLEEAQAERAEIEEKIVKTARGKGFENFNAGSPQQLSEFLFGENGLDIKPKPDKLEKSGLYKTDAATLESFVDRDPDAPEILKWIVKFRQIDKVIGTYLTSLAENTDENDCLRFNFKQTGAATGRFTAPQGEPSHGFAGTPIHGIPGRVDPNRPKCANSLRRLFIAHDGYTIIKIDYAGQELRVVTNISKEPLWTKEFLEGSGDLHTLTAQAFYGPHITKADKLERTAGKIANFSLIYGGGVQAIQRATKCNQHEAARKKKAFDASVPVFAKWVGGQHTFVKKHLGVFTGFGRFIRVPDANIKVGETDSRGKLVPDEKTARKIRAGCERKSTNYPIQGSGADILKISFVKLVKELSRRGWLRNGGDDSVRMLMTVHDEIVFEVRDDRVPEALPVLIEIMESPSTLAKWKIPLIVEPLFGRSWDAKYDWLEIQAGKAELPEWLVPHFEAFNKLPPKPQPKPQAPPSDPKKTTHSDTPAVEAPAVEVPITFSKTREVAVFCLPKSLLTEYSLRSVMKSIDGSIPVGTGEVDEKVYKRLRVVEPGGRVLVPSDLNIRVNPEEFGRGLRESNLGTGTYDLIEE